MVKRAVRGSERPIGGSERPNEDLGASQRVWGASWGVQRLKLVGGTEKRRNK